MPVSVPKRRNAFKPIGALRGGAYGGHKHGAMASLNLTPMVDMFTTLVIFLIQLFSATGDLMMAQKDLKLPPATKAEILDDRGPVLTLFRGTVLMEGKLIARIEEMDEAESGIPALSEELQKIRERDEKLFGRNPNEPFDGKIMIQGDKEADFKLVRKAIFSANEAGWAHLNFIVLGEGPVKTEGEGEATE